MRNILLVGVIMLSLSPLTAQNYTNFPMDSAQWLMSSVIHGGAPGFPSWDTESYRLIHLEGDTTINSKTYSKVHTHIYNTNNDKFIGGIREDSSKKVWYYPFDSLSPLYTLYPTGTETLIYDFGLNLGDSLDHKVKTTIDGNWFQGIGEARSYVVSIDTLSLLGGGYRKALGILTTHIDTFLNFRLTSFAWWVEGIGVVDDLTFFSASITILPGPSINFPFPITGQIRRSGLLGSLQMSSIGSSPPAHSDQIRCFTHNSIQLIGHNGVSNCGTLVTTAKVEDILDFDISFYPNPVIDCIHIQQASTEIIPIQIMDCWGRIIYQKEITDKIIQVSLPNLPAGIYFLHAQQGVRHFAKKFVKL